jgi:hypothetical protein
MLFRLFRRMVCLLMLITWITCEAGANLPRLTQRLDPCDQEYLKELRALGGVEVSRTIFFGRLRHGHHNQTVVRYQIQSLL